MFIRFFFAIRSISFDSSSADLNPPSNYTSVNSHTSIPTWVIDQAVLDVTTLIDEFPGGVYVPALYQNKYVSYYRYIYNWHTGRQQDWYSEYTSFYHVCYVTEYIYNSSEMPNVPDYDNPTTEIVDEFNFPVQDDFQAKIKNLADEIDMWQFGGVFDKDDKKIIGAILPYKTDAHKWNMSFAELRGGQYLFGIRKDEEQKIDGALFKIDKDGNSEKVGSGLKNFRLRELKKISKARR